ncbi:chloride channel protein [Caldisericum exile]|uniref:H(+)/Cl(-) exchange transporter n=1 Tax=Caldisericum exile (strain DSM 21853 / NBRC 104410 / AZM16c01) TaxID=511051 RepID=A0A7U6GFR1_CALEA|nr:chloride channel protein [Caldisericum exile]BAL81550.1 putative H(+)/Cl(-) exchange transporter [Caldisericum exile AZM16c01]
MKPVIRLRAKSVRLKGKFILKFLLINAIVGILTGIAVFIFYSVIKGINFFVLEKVLCIKEFPITLDVRQKMLLITVLTLAGLLSGFIQHKLLKDKEYYGTERIIDAIYTDSEITGKEFASEFAISSVILGAGGSAGYEGPSGGIGGAVGYFLGNIFRISTPARKILLASSIGAGIGAIFMSPIGGGILGAEIIQKKLLNAKVLPYSLVSSIVSFEVFSRLAKIHSRLIPFGITEKFSIKLLILVVLLGIFIGIFEVVFLRIIRLMLKGKKLLRKTMIIKIIYPAIGLFIVGIIISFFPKTLGGSLEWINYIKDNPSILSSKELIFLPFVKMIASAITVIIGKGGGLFVPSIFIGEISSIAFGKLIAYIFPNLLTLNEIVFLGIVGAFGLIGGIGNIPFAMAVIGVETTGNLSLIPYILLVSLISIFIESESLYVTQR